MKGYTKDNKVKLKINKHKSLISIMFKILKYVLSLIFVT